MILTEHHDKWINYAKKFADDDLAQDIVQDMYLRLIEKKDVNCSYVFLTIKSIYLNHKKKEQKYVQLNDVDIQVERQPFEIKEELQKVLNDMPFSLKECLLENQQYSLRKLQDRYNINYGTIRNMIIKAKNIIKSNETLNEYYGTPKGK